MPADDEPHNTADSHDIEEAPLLKKQPLHTERTPDGAGPEAPSSPLQKAVRVVWGSGTFCVAIAAFCFALAASLVKVIDSLSGMPVFEIVVIRSTFTMGITLVIAHAKGIHPIYGQFKHWHLLAARGLIGSAAMTVFYESLLRLPLADSITILFCNPAICAILAWALLGEGIGLLTILGCLASLCGVAFVSQPPFIFGNAAGAQEWSHDRMVGMTFAVLGAFLTSGAYIMIRVIGKCELSLTIAMWFHTSAFVSTGIPLLLGYPDAPVLPRLIDWVCLLGIGCCSFSAQLLLNRGFQLQVASKASAVNYTQVIYAYILGTIFFHEQATLLGVLGAALIAVGVVTVNADKKSGPAAAAKSDGGDKTIAGEDGRDSEAVGPSSGSDAIGSGGGSSNGLLHVATGLGAGAGEQRQHGVESGAEVGAGGRQQHRDRQGRLKFSSIFQREAGTGAQQRAGVEETKEEEEGGSSPKRWGVAGSGSQGQWQGASVERGLLIPAGRQGGALELHHVGRSQRPE